MKVVICGGGIIGLSCAYFLAKQNVSCTIIEQEDVACAASGRAGGFLSKTWCESNVCDELAKLSYSMHMELSKEFTDVDYRNVTTYSAHVNKVNAVYISHIPEELRWVDGPITKCSVLETKENTAQVHPKKLSHKFLEEAKRLTNNATQIIRGTVIGIGFDESGLVPAVKTVRLRSGRIIDADVVLIAMGPWSHKAMSWFPTGSIPQISSHRAHSVIMRAPKNFNNPADCIFLQFKNNIGTTCPEMYSRPDGTVYVSGFGDNAELPDRAAEVQIERWRCSQLREVAYATCSNLEASEILAEQACFLPLSPDGVPVIGAISSTRGGFIATAHSCWGILNSTGTGLAIAELITTGKCTCVDLTPFSPQRFQ